ncbi:MAG: LamG domain-containing protein [Candidatus Caldarchaeum sp.]
MSLRLEFLRNTLSFDGVDDIVTVLDSPSLDLQNAFTVALWVYPSTMPQAGVMLWKGEGDNPQYGLGTISSESGFRYWWTKGGTRYNSPLISVAAGAWSHIAYTYNGAVMKCYVNGADTGVDNNVSAPLDSFLTHDLLIGKRLVVAYAPFSGRIDGVRVYNRALNYNEVRILYYGGDIRDGLVLYLPMDEGSGSTVYDKSGNNNNGTIYGATWTQSWRDVTGRVTSLRRRISSRQLEELECEVIYHG